MFGFISVGFAKGRSNGQKKYVEAMLEEFFQLNLSEVTAFPESQCTKPACVESMTWSPDGAVLAVAMNDGHFHLIEAEQGVVRWSRKLGQNSRAQQMRWFWSGEPPGAKSRLKCDWPLEDEMKAVASIFGNGDAVDERLGKSLLYEILYLKSLRGTILFMIRDDYVVLALAGGILPLCEIRLMEKLAHLKLDVINIYDVLYTHRDGLTLAVTDYGPRPKLDEVDRDPIFTRSSARLSGEMVADLHRGESIHSEKKFGSPSFMADAINCPHTHLINLDFKLENEELLWELLLRYLKMYHCLVHLTYSMEFAKRDWESESKASVMYFQIFANRLNSTPHDLRLGDALLNSLLGGAPGPLAERWLERTLGAAGIQSMREFVEKRFSGLVAMLRGPLSAAARSLAFQMDQYRELVKELQDANTNYETLALPSWNVTSRPSEFLSTASSARIPDVTADHVFDALDSPTSRLILDRLHSGGIRIQAKCEEMTQAAAGNLRELSQLVRWMSLLTPLLKNTKRPAQVMEQNSKWDVATLLKYIVQTFTTDGDERELLSLSLFKIEEVLKELRAEETKEHYSHDEMIRVLVEEGALKRPEDDRTLSELLSSARKCPGSVADSPMCGPSDTSTPRANPPQRQVQNEFVLDKGLDKETRKLLGDRFGLEGVKDVVSLEDKTLLDLVNEVTRCKPRVRVVRATPINGCTSSRRTHRIAGFDSVRLSVFRWSDTKDMDVYERKLLNVKGKDLEKFAWWNKKYQIKYHVVPGEPARSLHLIPSASLIKARFVRAQSVVMASHVSAYCLVESESLRAGVQPEMTVSVPMQPGATFKSEAGEMNRLMRKHPMMEAWFVHSGLTSEASDSASLSADRQQGCIVSEEGSRVALFRVQNSPADEQPQSLLTEAPVHRPALQLLTHHTR
ncbi:putative bacteriochlorophyll 4-vinyl reductase [Ostertagia ostertagi]